MVDRLPAKLKTDAILEAVFEARFDASPATIPEIFFGRFADNPLWKDYSQRRLPNADIPAALRRADPSLRYQPSIELLHADGERTVRVGPQVMVYAARHPYPGWDVLGQEIAKAIDVMCAVIPEIAVTRLGLRYVNALRADAHGIKNIKDLNLTVQVEGCQLDCEMNLNYRKDVMENNGAIVRIATRDFVEGAIPENSTVIVDVDVYTKEPYQTSDAKQIKLWTELAHVEEKKIFFGLLTPETIKRLEAR